jgi:hypothetical protein
VYRAPEPIDPRLYDEYTVEGEAGTERIGDGGTYDQLCDNIVGNDPIMFEDWNEFPYEPCVFMGGREFKCPDIEPWFHESCGNVDCGEIKGYDG